MYKGGKMDATGDSTHKKPRKGFWLGIFLAILVIVAGVGAIIVVKNREKDKEDTPAEEIDSVTFMQDYYARVDEIYDNNPDNIMKVVDFFTSEVDEDSKNVRSVFMNEYGWFFERNIDNPEALLEGLTRLDYSVLADAEAYRIYATIVELAKYLEKKEVVKKYELLKNAAEEGYLLDVAETQRVIDEDASEEMQFFNENDESVEVSEDE